mgnify:CR=1 FL=1
MGPSIAQVCVNEDRGPGPADNRCRDIMIRDNLHSAAATLPAPSTELTERSTALGATHAAGGNRAQE